MAAYISLPILDELVRLVEEDSTNDNSVKAMASGILNHNFPPENGFMIAPKQDRNNVTDLLRFRNWRYRPGGRVFFDHALVAVKPTTPGDTSLQRVLEHLENALKDSNTEYGRCWVVLANGFTFNFYEYHRQTRGRSFLSLGDLLASNSRGIHTIYAMTVA